MYFTRLISFLILITVITSDICMKLKSCTKCAKVVQCVYYITWNGEFCARKPNPTWFVSKRVTDVKSCNIKRVDSGNVATISAITMNKDSFPSPSVKSNLLSNSSIISTIPMKNISVPTLSLPFITSTSQTFPPMTISNTSFKNKTKNLLAILNTATTIRPIEIELFSSSSTTQPSSVSFSTFKKNASISTAAIVKPINIYYPTHTTTTLSTISSVALKQNDSISNVAIVKPINNFYPTTPTISFVSIKNITDNITLLNIITTTPSPVLITAMKNNVTNFIKILNITKKETIKPVKIRIYPTPTVSLKSMQNKTNIPTTTPFSLLNIYFNNITKNITTTTTPATVLINSLKNKTLNFYKPLNNTTTTPSTLSIISLKNKTSISTTTTTMRPIKVSFHSLQNETNNLPKPLNINTRRHSTVLTNSFKNITNNITTITTPTPLPKVSFKSLQNETLSFPRPLNINTTRHSTVLTNSFKNITNNITTITTTASLPRVSFNYSQNKTLSFPKPLNINTTSSSNVSIISLKNITNTITTTTTTPSTVLINSTKSTATVRANKKPSPSLSFPSTTPILPTNLISNPVPVKPQRTSGAKIIDRPVYNIYTAKYNARYSLFLMKKELMDTLCEWKARVNAFLAAKKQKILSKSSRGKLAVWAGFHPTLESNCPKVSYKNIASQLLMLQSSCNIYNITTCYYKVLNKSDDKNLKFWVKMYPFKNADFCKPLIC